MLGSLPAYGHVSVYLRSDDIMSDDVVEASIRIITRVFPVAPLLT